MKIALLEPDRHRPIQAAARSAIVEGSPPRLVAVENTMDRGTAFRGFRAEKMRCVFESNALDLDASCVEAEIDGERIPAMLVGHGAAGQWEVNLRLPKDLVAGSHVVRLRTFDSEFSNELPFDFEPGVSWANLRG